MNLLQKRQIYYHKWKWNNRATLLLAVLLQHKFTFHFSCFSQTDNTLFYNQHNAFHSLQQRNTVDVGLWSRLSSFERKGSRWNPYSQLPGNFAGSLVFLAVPKTRFFRKSLASSSQSSQPTGNIWNERSTLQCWSTRYRHEGIRAIRCRRQWIQLRRSCSGYGQCLSTWNRCPFSPSIFDNFHMEGSTAADPIIVDDEEDKENSAPTTRTPESERPTEPPRLLRSRPFGTRPENVSESVYRTLFR